MLTTAVDPTNVSESQRPVERGADLRRADVAARDWLWLFSRPLAVDEERAHFWARHLRVGVVLTELAALLVVGYVWLGHRPHAVTQTLMASGLMLVTLLLLAVPMRRLSRDHRGTLIFYAWSAVTTAVISLAAGLDQGGASPLSWLLVLTLTYAGLAYPPTGVLLIGAVTVTAYIGIAASSPEPLTVSALPAGVLTLFTLMISWASRNHWDLADQQHLLTQRLATLAETDEFTGCLNRRAFTSRLAAALSQASTTEPVAVCVIDLDHFKSVNDRHGHIAGDAVLLTIVHALLTNVREIDSVGRIGGDEFAVLLPATTLVAASRAAERLVAAVDVAGRADGVTASIGVASTVIPAVPSVILAEADRLMYLAKGLGGGRVAHTSPAFERLEPATGPGPIG